MTRVFSFFLPLAVVCLATGAWAAEQPKTDVRVVNTPAESVPVAVQGTAAVAGTVEVTNVPTVRLDTDVVVPVRVVQPVPFQASGTAGGTDGDRLVITFSTPEGACFRIDHVSASLSMPAGSDQSVRVVLATYWNNRLSQAFLHGEQGHVRTDYFQVSQALTLYGRNDGDLEAALIFLRDRQVGYWDAWGTVAGAFIDCPE